MDAATELELGVSRSWRRLGAAGWLLVGVVLAVDEAVMLSSLAVLWASRAGLPLQ